MKVFPIVLICLFATAGFSVPAEAQSRPPEAPRPVQAQQAKPAVQKPAPKPVKPAVQKPAPKPAPKPSVHQPAPPAPKPAVQKPAPKPAPKKPEPSRPAPHDPGRGR